MNTQTSSKKTLFIIIGIVVIALIAFFYYEGSAAPSSTLSQTDNVSASNQAIGTRVLDLLNQIRTLRIDTSIFKDPAYSTLRDYSVAIPPQGVGRQNPFAPLSGSGSVAASSTRAR